MLIWTAVVVMGAAIFVSVYEPTEEIDPVEQELDSLRNRLDSLEAKYIDLHELSWENIDYWLRVYEIEHPEIVKRQIALETGLLTSAICQENNNLFGMKQARVRKTTALGTKRGHAYYSNYIESIKDYKLWQDSMYEGGDYYAFLTRVGYAENTRYAAVLKSI